MKDQFYVILYHSILQQVKSRVKAAQSVPDLTKDERPTPQPRPRPLHTRATTVSTTSALRKPAPPPLKPVCTVLTVWKK